MGFLDVRGYRLELFLVRVRKAGATFAMGRRMLELAVTAAMVALPAVDAGACRPKWPLTDHATPTKGEQHQVTPRAFALALAVLATVREFATTFAFHLRGVDLKRCVRALLSIAVSEMKTRRG